MKNSVLRMSVAILSILISFSFAMAAEREGDKMSTTDNTRTEQGATMDRKADDKAATAQSRQDMTEARQKSEETVSQATALLSDFSKATDKDRIPDAVLKEAKAMIIVPEVIRAGLIAGGRCGQGVLVTRNGNEWSNPVFISLGGASLGAQIGVESSDVIMVVQNQQVVDNLLQDNEFTLGADASVAAGDIGASAKTTTADVLTYQKTKGVFAGVALTGGVLDVDEDAMMAYYRTDDASSAYYGDEKEDGLARKIIDGQKADKMSAPQSAETLKESLKRFAPQS